jgi:Tol biopolymer transport system component
VYVSNRDGNFELYEIDRSGRGERRLTHTSRVDEQRPRFSRDGKRLLYVHAGHVASLKLASRRVRELGLGTAADWR